jgi:hypothetical protein
MNKSIVFHFAIRNLTAEQQETPTGVTDKKLTKEE